MSWNYRVIKKEDGEFPDFELHEVFYDAAGKVVDYTVEPVTFGGESVEEVISALRLAIDSLEKHGELVVEPRS